jgi:transcription initiation factor TFIID subunit 5
MPEETPASPQSSTASPAATSDPLQNASAEDRLIYDYLRTRGYSAAEKGLLESLESSEKDKDKTSSSTVSVDDLIRGLAVYAQKASRPGENVLRDKDHVVQELGTMGTPQKIQSLIASLSQIGAEEVLKPDPTDKHKGYRELEAWVDGSLDMYRVCKGT